MTSPEIKKNKQSVIVDTCVIQYSNGSKKAESEAMISCLKEIVKEDYTLAISEITIYENLYGLDGRKVEQAIKVLKTYEWKVISNDVLMLASILGGLYRDEKCEGPNAGDHIIAATTILENGLILTNNHRDFPHPFFITEKYIPVTFKHNHYFITRDITLYKPNFPILMRRINEKQIF